MSPMLKKCFLETQRVFSWILSNPGNCLVRSLVRSYLTAHLDVVIHRKTV